MPAAGLPFAPGRTFVKSTSKPLNMRRAAPAYWPRLVGRESDGTVSGEPGSRGVGVGELPERQRSGVARLVGWTCGIRRGGGCGRRKDRGTRNPPASEKCSAGSVRRRDIAPADLAAFENDAAPRRPYIHGSGRRDGRGAGLGRRPAAFAAGAKDDRMDIRVSFLVGPGVLLRAAPGPMSVVNVNRVSLAGGPRFAVRRPAASQARISATRQTTRPPMRMGAGGCGRVPGPHGANATQSSFASAGIDHEGRQAAAFAARRIGRGGAKGKSVSHGAPFSSVQVWVVRRRTRFGFLVCSVGGGMMRSKARSLLSSPEQHGKQVQRTGGQVRRPVGWGK